MTQEHKELLLKDLSARLPYGVKVLHFGTIKELLGIIPSTENVMVGYDINDYEDSVLEDIKPYLRPMSSMTEEERKEYEKICELDTEILANHPMNGEPFPALYNSQDWLNRHHFDYRSLIPIGLALEAPEGMYK